MVRDNDRIHQQKVVKKQMEHHIKNEVALNIRRPFRKFQQAKKDKDVQSHLKHDGLMEQLQPMRDKYAEFCSRTKQDGFT